MTYRKKNPVKSYEVFKMNKNKYEVEIVLRECTRITYDKLLKYVTRNINNPAFIVSMFIIEPGFKTLLCPNCKRTFYITNKAYSNWEYSHNDNISHNGPFCCEKCYHEYTKGKNRVDYDYKKIPDNIKEKIDSNKIKWKEYKCPVCKKKFILYGTRYSQRNKYEWMYKEKHHDGSKLAGPFCSLKCKNIHVLSLANKKNSKKNKKK